MQEISQREDVRKSLLFRGNNGFSINGNDIEIDVKHCELNENVKIYKEDMFSLPTVDEYIKLGMVLRCSHIRFSKKTNKLLIIEDLPFSIL